MVTKCFKTNNPDKSNINTKRNNQTTHQGWFPIKFNPPTHSTSMGVKSSYGVGEGNTSLGRFPSLVQNQKDGAL
jgi:hypothetical protein